MEIREVRENIMKTEIREEMRTRENEFLTKELCVLCGLRVDRNTCFCDRLCVDRENH